MKTLDLDTLAHVTGGASRNTELSSSLGAIQSSITSLANTKKDDSSNLLLPIMMLAMNRQKAPSVVSAGGATVVSGG